MDWQTASFIANVVLAIGVPPTIFLTWWGISQGAKNQRYVQFIARYQTIIINLPPEIFDEGNKIDSVEEDKRVWLTSYIDLCNEELFDRTRGAISKKVWEDWSVFIISNFRRCLPLRARLAETMEDYPQLLEFLNGDRILKEQLTAIIALKKL